MHLWRYRLCILDHVNRVRFQCQVLILDPSFFWKITVPVTEDHRGIPWHISILKENKFRGSKGNISKQHWTRVAGAFFVNKLALPSWPPNTGERGKRCTAGAIWTVEWGVFGQWLGSFKKQELKECNLHIWKVSRPSNFQRRWLTSEIWKRNDRNASCYTLVGTRYDKH